MIYVWQIRSFWGANRKRPTDYSVSKEFNSLKEALNFKENFRQYSIKNKDLILEDKDIYLKIRCNNHDTDMILKEFKKTPKYQYQLDDGTWEKEV